MAPTKSTITLLTNYTKEHRHTPQLTLDNTAIPHKHSTKILGVTYDTSLSFMDHIHYIKQKCTHQLNMLRIIAGIDFGQQKETLTLIYKQNISSVLEYASPAWAPNLAITHHNALQTIQKNTLRIITGCTQTTLTNHLHYDTRVLTLQAKLSVSPLLLPRQHLSKTCLHLHLCCCFWIFHSQTSRPFLCHPACVHQEDY